MAKVLDSMVQTRDGWWWYGRLLERGREGVDTYLLVFADRFLYVWPGPMTGSDGGGDTR